MYLQEFIESIGFKITGGDEFLWRCYGPNARTIDCEDLEKYSITCVYDTQTQEVYEINACDYVKERAYKYINPEYLEAYKAQAQAYGVSDDIAWDSVEYTHLDVTHDMYEKIEGIMSGEDYDDRVIVPLDLSDKDMLKLMIMAHEADMTFNEYIQQFLEQFLNDTLDKTKTIP